MIQRLTKKVKDLMEGISPPTRPEIMCGVSLAHHGLLVSLFRLSLHNVDLSPVPAHHLALLVSCVTSELRIENVSGCDLVNILSSVKCRDLYITRQNLGREETQALVQAMESGMEELRLNDVTLDIEALTEYSGEGECREVELWNDTATRYREQLRTWARSKDWKVSQDYDCGFGVCTN